MALSIKWNDAWESIPHEFASDVIERIREDLQTSHPLTGTRHSNLCLAATPLNLTAYREFCCEIS